MADRHGGELAIALAFFASAAAAIGLTVVYSVGGQPQLEGLFLGIALVGIGVGLALWAKRFLPGDEMTEVRGSIGSSEEDVAAFTKVFEAGGRSMGRRALLARSALGAFGALGVAALFPIRSLGPRPGRGLKETEFAEGSVRLVDEEGQALRPDDLVAGAVYTVFPEGRLRSADAIALLIRPPDPTRFEPLAGREGWTVDGIVAYSKLCTHLGCPVGLYQAPEDLLLCPCHQSTFDVLHHARPVFGPATRPLPQLPLGVDDDGYLVNIGDFSDPVGGGFWDRET